MFVAQPSGAQVPSFTQPYRTGEWEKKVPQPNLPLYKPQVYPYLSVTEFKPYFPSKVLGTKHYSVIVTVAGVHSRFHISFQKTETNKSAYLSVYEKL